MQRCIGFAMCDGPFTDAAYYLKLARVLKERLLGGILNASQIHDVLPLLDEAHRNWLIRKLSENEDVVVYLARFHSGKS